ncbi:MAG: adenosine kinase, partial [Hyphomicrobiaceae bacterium]
MAAAPNDIVAMGNAIVDIVCRCDDDHLARTSAPKGHMTLVHSLSEISELVSEMPGTFEVAGGAAVNAAVGVASLGGRSTIIGRVANDRLGNLFRHDIKGIGVTFRTPPTMIATGETSRSLVLVTPDGQRTMLTYLGCSPRIEIDDIDAQTIKTSKILHLEGYLFDDPRSKAALEEAVSLASAAGKLISFALPDSFRVHSHR